MIGPARVSLLVAAHQSSQRVAAAIAARFDGVTTRALADVSPISAADVVAVILPPSPPMVICLQVLEDVRDLASEVIIVTHHDHDLEVVLFGAGATDVIDLDASIDLVLARVAAACRRQAMRYGGSHRSMTTGGVLSVDFESHLVRADGRDVPLTNLQFQAVAALVARPGEVVPISALARVCATRGGDASSRTVRSIVGQLRRALGDFDVTIQTVKGRGYRLVETSEEETRSKHAGDSEVTRLP